MRHHLQRAASVLSAFSELEIDTDTMRQQSRGRNSDMSYVFSSPVLFVLQGSNEEH